MNRLAFILLICSIVVSCIGCGSGNAAKNGSLEKNAVPMDTAPEQVRVFVEVMEVDGDSILVKPEDGAWELNSSDLFGVPVEAISKDLKPEVGMWLEIIYSGAIQESYPACFSGIASITVAERSGRREEAAAADDHGNDGRISVGGPYGEISLLLAEGWTAEEVPVDSDKMMYGLYGLILKPEMASDGQVELFLTDSFGVCGTGLEEEEIMLAGNTAYVGTYDDHDHWDFIILKGDNPQIVAQHTDCDSWTENMWEEVLAILDTLQFDTDRTEGGIGQYIPESEIETEVIKKIELIYSECVPTTFCIYTSDGNNGTGFLYKEKYVITNAHVLFEEDEFILRDVQDREYRGTVVLSDYETDIAIIQLDDYQGQSVTFGDSDRFAVGEKVLLIGNPVDGLPFGYCTGTRIEPEEAFARKLDPENKFIALDANMISGYSGGPVFNLRGELIGISNAAYIGDLSEYDFDHLSFIIPINSVKELIEKNCA